MQEQTLAQIALRMNDPVACGCMKYTGSDECSCDPEPEQAKKIGCPDCGRLGSCPDCCCNHAAHRSTYPYACPLCKHQENS